LAAGRKSAGRPFWIRSTPVTASITSGFCFFENLRSYSRPSSGHDLIDADTSIVAGHLRGQSREGVAVPARVAGRPLPMAVMSGTHDKCVLSRVRPPGPSRRNLKAKMAFVFRIKPPPFAAEFHAQRQNYGHWRRAA